jgi:lipopolysaccharide heptosyltransferase II
MNHPLQPHDQPLPPEVKQRLQRLQPAWRFSPEDFPVQRFLVRSPNWVGDAVMSLPVLSGLQKLFPQADLTVLAARRVAPLFQELPGVTEVVPYHAGRGKWQVLWELRGRFDLALALPNSLESAIGLWLVGVPVRVGYAADGRRPLLNPAVSGRRHLAGLHTVFYYLGLLQALGEIETFTPPTLYLGDLEIATASQLLEASDLGSGPWVGLSPGAAFGPAKRWPPANFAALGRELVREFGARLVLLGGREEAPVAQLVKEYLGLPVLDLVGKTDLRQALGVLSRLQLLITNDSGLMHAAAALQAPLVALFGSTEPAATGPFTGRATVLHHPPSCAPCFQRTCNRDYVCLTAISVEEALAAARPYLTENL